MKYGIIGRDGSSDLVAYDTIREAENVIAKSGSKKPMSVVEYWIVRLAKMERDHVPPIWIEEHGSRSMLIDHIGGWDWETLVASWRYYEYRNTISSASFPVDIVERYWKSGNYSPKALRKIARQFVEIDHRNGESDWTGLWKDSLRDCDKLPWCKFWAFCNGYLHGFKTVVLDGKSDGKHLHEEPECFWCEYTQRWYPAKEYIENPWIESFCGEEYIKEVK